MPSVYTTTPTIGLLGFGAFGALMAQHLRAWFPLLAFDPKHPTHGDDDRLGVTFTDIAGVAAADIVILAVPVDQLAQAIATLRPHLRSGTTVLDVGSVKVQPVEIMRAELPEDIDIVGTHPLFGPQSARNGIAGLKIAVCPVRGGKARRIAAFLRQVLKLRVFLTTPEAHDREAAVVQGLTHLIAKVLVRMEPLPSRMTTPSFDRLVTATEMVRYDAPSVFLAIERANPYAAAVRQRFFALAEELSMHLEQDHADDPALAESLDLESRDLK